MIILEAFAALKTFLAGVVGVLIGLVYVGIVIALSSFITAKVTGARVGTIRIFGKTGTKGPGDEERNWHKDRFVLLPQVILFADIDQDVKTEYKKMNTIMNLITILFCGLYAFIIFYFYWKKVSFLATALNYSLCFIVIELIVLFVKIILFWVRKGNRLREFCQDKILEMKNGASFEQLNMSIPDGIFDKADMHSKVLYLHICFSRALWMKNFNALNGIVRQMDAALRKHGPNSEYIKSTMSGYGYYDILFYSSYVNKNANHALRIYNVIKPTLDADMDANGRRVLAYYQFYVQNQSQAASITLNQAIEALQSMNSDKFLKPEMDLERRLIEELQNNMTTAMNPGTFTQPIIENTFDDMPLI